MIGRRKAIEVGRDVIGSLVSFEMAAGQVDNPAEQFFIVRCDNS